MANACDFGHTSLLTSRIDLHPIAPGQIFQAAKKPRLDIPQLFEARIAGMDSAKVKRQKVRFPASVRREFLLDRTFSFRMPSRDGREMGDGMGDSRFCTL
ncbi:MULTISPECIES: hypothetical protein [unclassified Microcoleus]|uniref:hypothetical protein n=1 Tax=unclassified Microcoleus TaxID=2642155 RepID=UPI002FD21B73